MRHPFGDDVEFILVVGEPLTKERIDYAKSLIPIWTDYCKYMLLPKMRFEEVN